METFYLIIVIVLFILAISDLVVGVSNDAVNFLNSAVGAKAASLKWILFIAALGIIIGCTFSSGMMEVARKGIFNPEHFYFSEIILLFLAVMVTDIILLDSFNTIGLPTSTTVSIVFELLGAAVAFSVIKIYTQAGDLNLADYINAENATSIISGIFLSVLIAFTVGVVIQYLTRMLFSFNYTKRLKYFGSIWGGFAIAAITYFLLVKGVKGASFMTDVMVDWVNNRSLEIIGISFIIWVALFQIISIANPRFNLMKFIVMFGTFTLAMAFAGNDLVNFIGVPLAGFNSYELYKTSGAASDSFLMSGLAGKVPTPTILLLMAGLIMTVTLYASKKAKSVLKTSLDLGRQQAGTERFASYKISRWIVRFFTGIAKLVDTILPERWKNFVNRQFDQTPFDELQKAQGEDAPSFDLLRAATTLVVASILIAIGTSFKLPLSTTYVTFMVFMGTSLADGAWGRESAVYRVSGVLSVIGGWFFTAFSAFVVAFIISMIFHFGGVVAVIVILLLSSVFIYRTNLMVKKSKAESEEIEKSFEQELLDKKVVLDICSKTLDKYFKSFEQAIAGAIEGLKNEDLNQLSKVLKKFKPLYTNSKQLRHIANASLDKISEEELDAAHFYILVLEYVQQMANNVDQVIKPIQYYVDNNHKPFLPVQISELEKVHKSLSSKFGDTLKVFNDMDSKSAVKILEDMEDFVKIIRSTRKAQIKRIKNHEIGTRNSLLYLNLLGELRNLGWFASRMVKVYIDLIDGKEDLVPAEINNIEE